MGQKYKALKNPRLYIALAIALVITVILFPQEGKFRYNYQKGQPWTYETLLAPVDFPILKTQEELLEEKELKASLIIPYFNYDKSAVNIQTNRLRTLQERDSIDDHFLFSIIESLYKIYDVGITSGNIDEDEIGTIIVQRDKRAEEIPTSQVFTIDKAERIIKYNLSIAYPDFNVDSIYNKYNISSYLVPNLIQDKNKTDLYHKEAVDYISPTKGMMYAGQLIVSKGEIVTPEIEQLLDSFKEEYQVTYGYAGSLAGLIIGHFIICLLALGAFFAIIFLTNRSIFEKRKSFYFILTLYVIIFAITSLVSRFSPHYLLVVPYAVFALYLTMFFKRSFVYPLYTIMLLPLLFLVDDGEVLFFLNLVGGIIAIVSSRHFSKGWLLFVNSLFVFAGMFLTYLAFCLVEDGSISLLEMKEVSSLLLNSLLVVAAHPFVFVFEKIFSLVSNSRLMDLSDPNNKLLRELSQKAPGTFQHSLQVSNLASDAARAIGADVTLTRVGALYHDIGKMLNPQCFVENVAPGVNYHKDLTPMESAQQIIRHVDDGVDIAKKHNLPKVVIDFIITHHAQTMTFYFYNTYCNNGGDPENKEPFSYHGELPTTKEQVIVLMADAVEAASRTLKDYSSESISALVDNIIGKRLSDSQLVKADISIREIIVVKQMFKEHLEQVYHQRIAYPKLKKHK